MPANASDYTDVKIRILSRQPQGYPVELSVEGSHEDRRGFLDESILPFVASGDPQQDGQRLFAALFADEALRTAWGQAGQAHPQRRIRLRIDADTPELHALPWELLRAGGPGLAAQMLAADTDSPFSRFLADRWDARSPITDHPIKLLVAIANPTNLADYDLAAIDVAAEQQTIRQATRQVDATRLSVTFITGPVTLTALEAELSKGYHLLHLVAHGLFDPALRETTLYLADERDDVALVSDGAFAAMLARQDDALRMVFLASCQSAARSPEDSFAGLAPQLIRAGVPAVVAMQDLVTVETARRFEASFYRQLLDHGQVDVACNQARSALLSAGKGVEWGIPVLYSQVRAGLLIQPEPRPRTWRERLRQLPGVAQALAIGGALLAVLSIVALMLGLLVDLRTLREPEGLLHGIWPAATPPATPIVPLPDNFFNIGVAQFAEIDASGQYTVTAASRELSDWLFLAMQDQMGQFPDLSANYRGPTDIGFVKGSDPQAQADQAAELARPHNLTILIYGAISQHEDGYYVEPQFFVSHQGFGYGSEIIGPSRLGQPVRFALPLLGDPAETREINAEVKARRRALQHVVAGLVYLYFNDFVNAGLKFGQALEEMPEQGREVVYLLLGAAWLSSVGPRSSQDQLDTALGAANNAFASALALNPDYPRSYLGLGSVALTQAQLSTPPDLAKLAEAGHWYATALELAGPGDAGNQAPAERPFDARRLAARAAYGLAQVDLLAAESDGRSLDRAHGYLDQVIETYEADTDAPERLWYLGHGYAHLGRLAMLEGDDQAAIDQLKRGIDLLEAMPGRPPRDWIAFYWSLVGWAEAQRGRPDAARDAYRRAVQIGEQVVDQAGAFDAEDLAAWRASLDALN